MTEVKARQRWAAHNGHIVFVKYCLSNQVVVEPVNVSGTAKDKPVEMPLEDFRQRYKHIPDLRKSLWRSLSSGGLARVMEDLGWSVRLYHVKTKRTTHLTLRTFLRNWIMQEDGKGKVVQPIAWKILMEDD
jgi:hypothetical protein